MIAPVLGVVLATIVVLVLWWIMRMRRSSARRSAAALSESEAEFLDSSHIISGPISRTSAGPRQNTGDKSAPPPDRLP